MTGRTLFQPFEHQATWRDVRSDKEWPVQSLKLVRASDGRQKWILAFTVKKKKKKGILCVIDDEVKNTGYSNVF